MDDRELEARLRTHLHRRLDDPQPPRELAASVAQLFATQPWRLALPRLRARSPMRPGLSLTAAAAVVVMLVVAASNLGLRLGPPSVGATPSPSAGPTERAFIVLPPSADVPSKPESIVATDVLSARLRALGIGNFTVSGGYGMTFTLLDVGGPSDDDIRAVLAATGEASLVPLPPSQYRNGQPTDVVIGQPLPRDDPPLFRRTDIAAVAFDSESPANLVITLGPAAKGLFASYSAAHVGEWFAILVDSRVAILAMVQAEIPDGVIVIGNGVAAPPYPARAVAVLIGGELPASWRGAPVPTVITPRQAQDAAIAQEGGTSDSASLTAELIDGRWRAVWKIGLVGTTQTPIEEATVDATTGGIVYISIAQP